MSGFKSLLDLVKIFIISSCTDFVTASKTLPNDIKQHVLQLIYWRSVCMGVMLLSGSSQAISDPASAGDTHHRHL